MYENFKGSKEKFNNELERILNEECDFDQSI